MAKISGPYAKQLEDFVTDDMCLALTQHFGMGLLNADRHDAAAEKGGQHSGHQRDT
ncbi:hypothetical protein MY5147_005395 [Beauveria neobassiana]